MSAVCFIDNLPPELLSRIFEVGSAVNESEDKDDMPDDDLIANGADEEDTYDSDSEEELEDEDGDGDEEGTDDEEDSGATGSSDSLPPWLSFQVVVSHVCRHWRNVAFSTPSLWTTNEATLEARPPYESVSTWLDAVNASP